MTIIPEVNLYQCFLAIKEQTDEILSPYNNNDFIEDPSVDVKIIAEKAGIKDIYLVPPEYVQHEHSYLTKEIKIFLNENDSPEEHRFSIGHEIAHRLLRKGDNMADVSRIEADPRIEDRIHDLLGFDEIIEHYSKVVAEWVSQLIGKSVTNKKAFQVLTKEAKEILAKTLIDSIFTKKPNNKDLPSNEIRQTLINGIGRRCNDVAIKIIEEEIADYFSACLLVPANRFVLWEDRTDEEIASAFKVNLWCIKKRREEVKHEIAFMVPPNQSSCAEIEEQSPSTLDELDIVLEGDCFSDTG